MRLQLSLVARGPKGERGELQHPALTLLGSLDFIQKCIAKEITEDEREHRHLVEVADVQRAFLRTPALEQGELSEEDQRKLQDQERLWNFVNVVREAA